MNNITRIKLIPEKYLIESVKEISTLDDGIEIVSFDMKEQVDKEFIKNNAKMIYSILVDAYSKIGGPKGLTKEKYVYKNSDYVRLAFYNNTIVSVALYRTISNYGVKMTYGGAVGGDYHKKGVIGLQCIINRDHEHIEEFNWMEVSGKIKEYCQKLHLYNLESKNIKEILPNSKIEIIDQFNYYRQIGGEGNPYVEKTIFGFPNKEILNEITNTFFGKVTGTMKEIVARLEQLQYNKIIEDNVPEKIDYSEFIELCRRVIVTYISLYNNYDIHEFPKWHINMLRSFIYGLNKVPDKNEMAKNLIKNGTFILNVVTELSFIKTNFKLNK